MRSEEELQRAHDTLLAVTLGEVHVHLTPRALTGTQVALDVLCWALNHDHNDAFEGNMANLKHAIASAGYAEKGLPRPMNAGEIERLRNEGKL